MSKPTEDQINEVLNRCSEKESEGGSEFPGMTYEQGVAAGINYALGYDESNPLE